MKSFLAILLMSVFAFNHNQSHAQSKLPTNDPAAKLILDKVSAKFKTYKDIEVAFTLKVENSAGNLLANSAGTLLMKAKSYRIVTKQQVIIANGIDMWTYDPEVNEVQISKLDPSDDQLTPQKLFSDFYDKEFLYKLNGEQKLDNNKIVQEVEMTPTNKAKSYHKVIVLIDKATNTITSAKVLEKNGNRFTYTVTKFNGHATFPTNSFVFEAKKYPGVEVIDLR